MHHISTLNWLAIAVATLSSFVLGSLWYGPLFGKGWMQDTGMTKEKGAQVSMLKTFGGTFVLNLAIAFALATLIGPHAGWKMGLHAGLFGGLFFVATAIGVIYLFEQRSLRLWLINSGYQVVNFSIMGTIIGLWP
jgi:hypothetical protein